MSEMPNFNPLEFSLFYKALEDLERKKNPGLNPGFTPDFNPAGPMERARRTPAPKQAPGMPEQSGNNPALNPLDTSVLDALSRQNNAMNPLDTSTLDQLSAMNAADPRSIAGTINDLAQPVLGKMGGVGKFLSGTVDTLEKFGDGMRGAAERGVIGGIAPRFQGGVQDAANRRLQEAIAQSTMGLNQAKTIEALTGDPVKASTALGKLNQDLRNGLITQQQFDAEIANINVTSNKDRQDSTAALRGEYRKDTDGVRGSLLDLAKAKQLLAERNPIAATAAFTSFIRSIDNSVVRPAEQAAYSAAGGLARRLQDELSKLQGKGPLSDATAADLLSSIETLENELGGILDRTGQFYGGQATRFGLRPDDITGIPSAENKKVDLAPTSAEDPLQMYRDNVKSLDNDQLIQLLDIIEESM